MAKTAASAATGKNKKPIGIIDLGSNSVRLVVFVQHDRAMVQLYNEKELCALGKGLEKTGQLNAQGMIQAITALARYRQLAEAMGVKNIPVLATAATREAVNGRAFLEQVRIETGLQPRIISGDEEARLTALGVVAGHANAQGMAGDLGGGSLELATLGAAEEKLASLPLGPLRLMDAADGRISAAEKIITDQFKKVNWFGAMMRKDFYAIGGAWRAVAKAHLEAEKYPLHVVHDYTVPAAQMAEFAKKLSELSPAALERMGVDKKRSESLPFAALLLERCVAHGRPERVVFSANGLREGYLYNTLTPAEQKADPLLRYASYARARLGEGGLPQVLTAWTDGLFAKESAAEKRLRHAACLLSDNNWADHPDYRASRAYQFMLALPVGAVTHFERAFLAIATYVRHEGVVDNEACATALGLLSYDARDRAIAIGLVLRLAYGLSGGAAAALDGVSLKTRGGDLVLNFTQGARSLCAGNVEKRLGMAARAMSLNPRVSGV